MDGWMYGYWYLPMMGSFKKEDSTAAWIIQLDEGARDFPLRS